MKKFAASLSKKQVDSTLYAQNVLPMCLEKPYDIIFLGYDLGDKQKNGQQLLEELRLSEVISRHCIVIIITAEVSKAMVLAAIEHKPDSYLCKPYTLQQLKKRLDKCMAKKAAMLEIYSAIEADEYERTIKLVDQALVNGTPYKTECLGIKSRQFFNLKKYQQAAIIYNQNLNQPNCQWANIGLGKIALEETNLDDAKDIFKRLIMEHPLYLPGYDWLAKTYQQMFLTNDAEETLEHAINLSPRSVTRLKHYGHICYDNEHFEKATVAFLNVYNLAVNSIHQAPENAISFAKSLAGYSGDLPIMKAKKLNNLAFSMLATTVKNYPQAEVKIQSHLLSACLLENIHDYVVAKTKLNAGLSILEQEQQNLDYDSLTNIAEALTRLNRGSKASQILISINQQKSSPQTSPTKIGDLTAEQLNESQTLKAQKALEHGKGLYDSHQYREAIEAFNEALILFPSHKGIKLNLLQVLLADYEEDKFQLSSLKEAKKLILGLLDISKDNSDYLRLKKMKKKYQQLASI